MYLWIAGMVLSITFRMRPAQKAALPEMRLMALRALALEKGFDEDNVDAAMNSGEPKAALIRLLQTACPS